MPEKDTKFKKGVSGNPKGRPKKKATLTNILEDYGQREHYKKDNISISKMHALAETLWELALNKDMFAIKYIYDRIDGKPLQQIQADVKSDIIVNFVKEYEGL